MAKATPMSREKSSNSPPAVSFGSFGIRSPSWKVVKCATPPHGWTPKWISEPNTAEQAIRTMAKFGQRGRHFCRAKYAPKVVAEISSTGQRVCGIERKMAASRLAKVRELSALITPARPSASLSWLTMISTAAPEV